MADWKSTIRSTQKKLAVPEWCTKLDAAKESRGDVICTSPHDPNPSYRVGKKLGEGAFGIVFEGIKLADGSRVAIKFELQRSVVPQLRDEYRAYKALAGCEGIPRVHFYDKQNLHNILVLDLLGLSLEEHFDRSRRRFTLRTAVMVGKQLLSTIRTMHEKGWIHCDIKPENFLTKTRENSVAHPIYLIDFGLAKQYRDPKTKKHIPYREKRPLTGTVRYMSINAHLEREQSRRDDLEAAYYTLLYFRKGRLPWQGRKAATKEQKYKMILDTKQSITIEDLCEGCPEEFSQSLRYVRRLKFDETPDYDFLDNLLTRALDKGEEMAGEKFELD